MLFIDIIFWLLLLFLTYFVIHSFSVVFYSSRGRLFDVSKKISNQDYTTHYRQNITVIIYSHNNSQKVKELIELLKNQDYEKNRYSINILLDNCNDENIKLLEIIGGTKLWRINTDVNPIGRYKAFGWMAERLMAYENTNVFVFLGADCRVKSDFLLKVNSASHYYNVVAGEVVKKKNNFFNVVFNLKNRLKNRVIRHGRAYSDLGNFIESEVFVIRQEILEKVKFLKTDFGFEDYEYSIDLIKNSIPVLYSGEVQAAKSDDESLKSLAQKEYRRRYRSFITFRNNFALLFSRESLAAKELVLSLLYPSNTLFFLFCIGFAYIITFYPQTYFSKFVSINYIWGLAAAKLLADFYATITAKFSLIDYRNTLIIFFLTPYLYFSSLFAGFFTDRRRKKIKTKEQAKSEKNINKVKADKLDYEKQTVNATVTNGKKELPCQLEIVKTNQYFQVTFIFNHKKLISAKQPRINYALDEIIEKLKNHGFAIKICANCGFFLMTESTAAHSDGEEGFCLEKNYNVGSKEKEFTFVWDCCKNIIPSQAKDYILSQLGVKGKK